MRLATLETQEGKDLTTPQLQINVLLQQFKLQVRQIEKEQKEFNYNDKSENQGRLCHVHVSLFCLGIRASFDSSF